MENDTDIYGDEQKKNAPDNLEIIFFLMSVQFVGMFFFGGYRTIFPFILLKLGYTSAQIATDWAVVYTIALFIGGFGTRVPLGLLSDVLTRKQGLLFGTLVSLISILLMNFTNSLIVLGILFALLRTGTHIYPLTTRGYINEIVPTRQRKINGYIVIGVDIASFFAPITLGILLDLSIQTLIIVSCLTLLITAVLLNFTTPTKLERKKLPVKTIFFKAIDDLKQIWEIMGFYFLLGFVIGTFSEILVPFMENTLHLSSLVTDFYVGIIQLTAIIFILIQGRLKGRFSLFFLIITGLIFIILGATLIYIGGINLPTFIIGSMLINGGIQIDIISIVTSITLTASKETAATCFGIGSSLFFLGASFIPLFASYIYNINPMYPYLLIILLGFIILVPVIYVRSKYQKRKGLIT